ncbi:MAG: hypothetical protein IH901_05900, partial [Proteobacteria bacterium]|nr:hypothetical protein [Pseudomonadota bacterium]
MQPALQHQPKKKFLNQRRNQHRQNRCQQPNPDARIFLERLDEFVGTVNDSAVDMVSLL